MTLTIAWIRDVGDFEELVFCSDSRLRFGCAWDSCQKIFPLPRGDCAIAFAGETHFAYPFINTAINAVTYHRGSNRRQVDLFTAKSILLNAINAMLAEIRDLPKGQSQFDEPNLRLAFGGYCWKKKKFAIWKFEFNSGEREFRVREVRGWKHLGRKRVLLVLGDPNASPSSVKRAVRIGATAVTDDEDVEAMAKKELVNLLEERGAKNSTGLDMEPFEILKSIIKSKKSPHIGGAPQLVKVYQHLNAQAFGIRWPGRGGRVAVLGRLLPHGEKMHVPILNPTTLRVEKQVENVALESITT